MRRIRKIIIVLFSTLFIMGGILTLRLLWTDKSPSEVLEMTRKAVSEARRSRADIYASDLFKNAESLFDSAMNWWQAENEKNFLIRDYGSVIRLASHSAEYARQAKIKALNESRMVQVNLRARIDSLKEKLASNQELFSALPLPETVFASYSKGKMNLTEAESAIKNEQFVVAEEKIQSAEGYILGSYYSADQLLKEYFKNYKEWQKWVKNSIGYSERNQSRVIIIDKITREIIAYCEGKPIYTFPIELGENWIGDKCFKGDKATPEGDYKVIEKKQLPHTDFYKALLLDYPNSGDVKRFRHDKKTGKLPGSAEIGGFIEIHGEGGRGSDWTDGCIALENSDMDILYSIVEIGARVTIVGSVKPFEEIWRTSL